jgi:CrcB protein
MKLLIQCLVVGAGGFIGALCRFGIAAASTRLFGTRFPVGTLVINLSGSLILGWFVARVGRGWDVSPATQLAVTVGFLGAYTTFSTFMFESDAMIRDGMSTRALVYLAGSLLMGLVCVRLGFLAGHRYGS